jgi:hypothetical protein
LHLMEFSPNFTYMFCSIFQSLQCEAYDNQHWSLLNVTTVHLMHFLITTLYVTCLNNDVSC